MKPNLLIALDTIVDYANISAKQIEATFDDKLQKTKDNIKAIKKIRSVHWQNSAEVLLNSFNDLNKAFAICAHFNLVADSDQIRQVYQNCVLKLQKFSTNLEQDKKIYQLMLQLKKQNKLNNEQQRFLDLEIKKYQKQGVHLSSEKRKVLKKIDEKLANCEIKFMQNVQDSTNQFSLVIEQQKDLSGLSATSIQNFKKQADKASKKGFLITLNQPNYLNILQNAHNRNLRKKLHQAWSTRGSQKPYDNSQIISDCLKLRYEKANLLGFKDYASYNLSDKMAGNYDKVAQLLMAIWQKTQSKATQELKQLETFAKDKLGLNQLKAYDISFVIEKYKQEKFGFNEQSLRAYFPLEKVLAGLFFIIENLYQIKLKKANYPTWHKEVLTFDLIKNKKKIGVLYADLFARSNKKAGAWMSEYQCLVKNSKLNQIPVAFINGNFAKEDQDCYLSFEDVLTLFHETGHSLHHLLTKIKLLSISGINSVQWDAVELPSQMMENFCYNWHYLQLLSEHKKSKKPIDLDLFEKIIDNKNAFSGLFLSRQLSLAFFDLNIHQGHNYQNWQQILAQTRKQILITPIASYDRIAHSFLHIFAGGYASAYYSYLWADVLASDVYGYFVENSPIDKPTAIKNEALNHYFVKSANANCGNHFLKNILARGAIKDADQLFYDFRDRQPKEDYLYNHYGIN